MLTNTLGILIGYVTVVLLFSLMVTSLSQAAQQLLNVRSKFLRRNVVWLINELKKKDIVVPAPVPVGAQLAASSTPSPTQIADTLVSKDVTWLEKEELLADLKEKSVPVDPSKTTEFDTQFEVMSRYASKEFETYMKSISLAFAVILAVMFQLSTFDLLKRLSTEPELRAGLDALAVSLVQTKENGENVATPFEQVSPDAIAQFKAKHPELHETLDPLSGVGTNRAALEDELRLVLATKGKPEVEKLVAEYGAMVDELHRKAASAKLADAGKQVDRLALYDIVIWPHDWRFFISGTNALGVLVSAVLISLGAPFWFNTLKNLLNLRDALKPRDQK
jgi:hypothetical protein